MSDVVFQGGLPGAWYHFAGGDIARVSSYPFFGPAPFAGVAGSSTATAMNGLTLPAPVDDMLMDQWLRVSKWTVALHVPEPAVTIGPNNGYAFDLEFDIVTGANATISGPNSGWAATTSTTTPVDQETLKLGGVETRIIFSDPHEMMGTNPDAGTTAVDTNRDITLVIRHGEWAWHGPLSKWCAGLTLDLYWSAIDSPAVEFDTTTVANQPDPPESVDNCPAYYHWDGSPGTNNGNETDPLWEYGCEINYYSAIESATGNIDPDMERGGTLGIDANDYFQIGTFLGRPMYVRMDRVEGHAFWDVWEALINMTIDITAAEYYPLP
jgi:hypothetical protein